MNALCSLVDGWLERPRVRVSLPTLVGVDASRIFLPRRSREDQAGVVPRPGTFLGGMMSGGPGERSRLLVGRSELGVKDRSGLVVAVGIREAGWGWVSRVAKEHDESIRLTAVLVLQGFRWTQAFSVMGRGGGLG